MKLRNKVRCRVAGYSLCECAVVCALIMFILFLAVSQVTYVHSVLVRAQVNALYEAIQMIQHRAISTNSKQKITIDLDNHRYWVNADLYILSSYVRFGIVDDAMGPPSYPVRPIVRACTFPDNSITCWPDGIIQAGVLYVVDHKKRYGYAISNAVGSLSHLRIYRYEQNKWRMLA